MNVFLTYCKNNPILTAISLGLVVCIFVLLIIMPIIACKQKNRAKTLSQTTPSPIVEEKPVVMTVETVEIEKIQTEKTTEEKSEPTDDLAEKQTENTAKVEQEIPVPAKEERKEIKAEEVKTEEVKTETATPAPKKPRTKKSTKPKTEIIEETTKNPEIQAEVVEEKAETTATKQPRPAKKTASKKAVGEEKPKTTAKQTKEVVKEESPCEEKSETEVAMQPNVENTETEIVKKPRKKRTKPNNPQKQEKVMLLDELKDVEYEIDFYEEDENDRRARYSGRWVICRIVTEETPQAPLSAEETYFFELHASNGEKLLSSEEYTSYEGALSGIETHKKNIANGNFKITLSKKGDYIFKLLSGKNLLLCMGENYPTRAACESAIESTKRFSATAIIDENMVDHVVKLPIEDESEVLPLPDGYNGKWIISANLDVNGEQVYYFELYANNGEKLLSSEEYTTYIGAVNGIETHRKNIKEGNFRITLTKRGDYIYKLLNRNGQLLCLGEHYKTKRRCQNAVESVKRFALNSPVLTSSNLKQS